MTTNSNISKLCGLPAAFLVVCIGCAPKETRLQIVDYREGGDATRYVQTFEECYYRFDDAGQVDIVARHRTDVKEDIPTQQVVHIRTFWIARPGQTEVGTSMINAKVSYMITSWPSGATFEGSGFLSFKHDGRKNRLRADLELSSLVPHRRLGQADRLFERAEVSGRLYAQRDDARVVSMLNEMRRTFGPLPDYHPPQGLPEPR